MTDKLKPCPFCGGEAILNKRISSYDGTAFYGVLCVNTGCCDIPSLYTKDQAVDKWNTRKPMDRIVEQLEGLPNVNSDYWNFSDLIDRDDALEIVKGAQDE